MAKNAKILEETIEALRIDKGNLELKLKIREDDIQKLKAQIEDKDREIFVLKSERKNINLFKKIQNLIKKLWRN